MIERYQGIARYVTEKTGVFFSEDQAWKLARRARDPLPVRRFLGRIVAAERDLDAWIERQWAGGTAAPAVRRGSRG